MLSTDQPQNIFCQHRQQFYVVAKRGIRIYDNSYHNPVLNILYNNIIRYLWFQHQPWCFVIIVTIITIQHWF